MPEIKKMSSETEGGGTTEEDGDGKEGSAPTPTLVSNGIDNGNGEGDGDGDGEGDGDGDGDGDGGGDEAEMDLEELDDSEEEDMDFNPFLKGSPSREEEEEEGEEEEEEGEGEEEASSSLSSEVEVLDNVVDDVDSAVDDGEIKTSGTDGEQWKADVVTEEENRSALEKVDDGFVGGSVDVGQEDTTLEAQVNGHDDDSGKQADIDLDDEEDAISKRTRARYSLASFTLDELESFLQETDDEDDLNQNVDEEEEYRKFLAAVLLGSDEKDNGVVEEGKDDDDDDEDNDADFDIEIEEALESDVDDCVLVSNKNDEIEKSGRRPETRQNRRQQSQGQDKKKRAEQEKNRSLRPILPIIPRAHMGPIPCMGTRPVMWENSAHYMVTGFVPHQIGQLHCLIYEHVQLLIQTYALCALDPSRQKIASQMKGLLSELLHKRDLALAWRNTPYPTACFLPSSVRPTVSDEIKHYHPVEDSRASSQQNGGQESRWSLSVGGSVLSVLDVAPLKLAGKFIDDVSNAVREHQRRCVETADIFLEKQPLFPASEYPSVSTEKGSISKGASPRSQVSTNPKLPKKSMAAALVESTKKQSVALVSRQIAQVAHPFCSLFNPALFPHKPPLSAVANRVLFTDAEDGLLAMGMMEYNNNWKSIKARFLPCKSEHQIFIRAKNRCSSKAPDNPIKKVRKMKSSPLTEEEKARIHEALQVFKLDWTSIWKTIVPYRDPNLLCRQWRTATGTQKTYKFDPVQKEKRRIYELNRRRSKAVARENYPSGSEETEASGGQNESGEDCVDNSTEACLHEAFLSDWRPPSTRISSGNLPSGPTYGHFPVHLSTNRCSEVQEGPDNQGIQGSQTEKDRACEVLVPTEDPHLKNSESFRPYTADGYNSSKSTFISSGHELPWHSHRTQKPGNSNWVKLAPELPPVKLPPAVRVIPQASFRRPQRGRSKAIATSSGIENTAHSVSVVNSTPNGTTPVIDTRTVLHPTVATKSFQESGFMMNGRLTEERGSALDPQMHPLLFRTPEESQLPCYLPNSSSGIPTFSFFPVGQRQVNVNLLNPHSPNPASSKSFPSEEITPPSSSHHFHPLLQRTNDLNVSTVDVPPSSPLLSTDLELSRDGFRREEIIYRAGVSAAQLASARSPSPSPSADANDLDLDIRLSSTSRKRKVSSAEGAETNFAASLISGTEFIEVREEGTDVRGTYPELACRPSADSMTKEHMEPCNFDGPLSQTSNGNSSAYICENVSVRPPLEIVMEQEELSDSDEEMEDVHFECEEMADSEGDGSDSEQIVNPQNKEHIHTMGTDCLDLNSGQVLGAVSKRSRAQRKRKTPRNSVGRGKGGRRSSWLSLSTLGSHSPPQTIIKSSGKSSDGTPAPSNSNNFSKKPILSSKSTVSGPLSSQSRKPRKQASKVRSPLRAGLAVGNDSCSE